MELDVLEGGVSFIEAARPYIYLENNNAQRSPDLIRWLQGRDDRLFWHFSPFFNPHNFRHNPMNVFGAVGDLNMIAVRPERAAAFARFPHVAGADDTWPAALARVRDR
jgi:hypothetical protein